MTSAVDARPRRHICGYSLVEDQRIGEGSYGHLWLAQRTPESPVQALKVIPDSVDQEESAIGERLPDALHEARILSLLRHPNVMHAHKIFTRCDDAKQEEARRAEEDPGGTAMYIVMDRAVMDTNQWMEEVWPIEQVLPRRNTRPQALRLAFQFLCGLRHMHRQGLSHLDIKTPNLLLFNVSEKEDDELKKHAARLDLPMDVPFLNLKLADFGSTSSRSVSPPTGGQLTTVWWRSPEVQCGSIEYGAPADMWAAGLILAELLLGLRPPLLHLFVLGPGADGLPVTVDDDRLFEWMVKFRKQAPSQRFYDEWTSRKETTYSGPLPASRENDALHRRTEDWCPMLTEGEGKGEKKEPVSIRAYLSGPVQSRLSDEYGARDFALIADLVDQLLEFEPERRPTAEEALSSPLFTDKPYLGACSVIVEPQVFLRNAEGKTTENSFVEMMNTELHIAPNHHTGFSSRAVWRTLPAAAKAEASGLLSSSTMPLRKIMIGLLLSEETIQAAARILLDVTEAKKARKLEAKDLSTLPAGPSRPIPRWRDAARPGRGGRSSVSDNIARQTAFKYMDAAAALLLAANLTFDPPAMRARSLAALLETYWPKSVPVPSRDAIATEIVERSRAIEELLEWRLLGK